MKKYYFVNFTIVIKSNSDQFQAMSVLSTKDKYFPIQKARAKITEVFEDKDEIAEPINIIFNNFQEVPKECFDEFHKNDKSDFAEID